MDKLKFKFTVIPGPDGKTNIYALTSITTPDNKSYAIPEDYQAAGMHKELIKTPAYTKIKNSLKKRYQVRTVWIPMTPELLKVYVDADGNMQFEEQFLEEIQESEVVNVTQQQSTLEKILEKMIEKNDSTQQSLKSIADKFVLEKFTSNNSNAKAWIATFEKECTRCGINTDDKKIEILRLFMEKSCIDWYHSVLIKLTHDSEWEEWRNKFCETFANKGWHPVTSALDYKYKYGSLLDYAIRKEKLLLDMRNSIDTGTLIDLIAVGLPPFIINRIDRESLTNTTSLFNEISKHEHMVSNKKFSKDKNVKTNAEKLEKKSPCKTCESLNKGIRYHPETQCWFKSKENENKNRKDSVKLANNSVIEAELNETNQKNEQEHR